jgi:hypothetical protein
VPETTRSIDISPSKASKPKKMPSYLRNGRYSDRKSPSYKALRNDRNRSRSRTPDHTTNLSTNVSDSNIMNTTQYRQEKKSDDQRFAKMDDGTIANPNLLKSASPTPQKPKRNQFENIQIDHRSLIEGSQIPEQPASGYTTEAESVEKTQIIEDVFLPDLFNGEYVRISQNLKIFNFFRKLQILRIQLDISPITRQRTLELR